MRKAKSIGLAILMALCVILFNNVYNTAFAADEDSSAATFNWGVVETENVEADLRHAKIRIARITAKKNVDWTEMENFSTVCSDNERFSYDVDGVHVLAEFNASCANTGSCNGHGAFIADAGVNLRTLEVSGAFAEVSGFLSEIENEGNSTDPSIRINYLFTITIDDGNSAKTFTYEIVFAQTGQPTITSCGDVPDSTEPSSVSVPGEYTPKGTIDSSFEKADATCSVDLTYSDYVFEIMNEVTTLPQDYQYSASVDGSEVCFDYNYYVVNRGEYCGHGRYIHEICPVVRYAKAFGADMSFVGKRIGLYNIGTKVDPIAAAMYLLQCRIETVNSSIYKSYTTLVKGNSEDDALTDISGYLGPEKSGFAGVAKTLELRKVSNQITTDLVAGEALPGEIYWDDLEGGKQQSYSWESFDLSCGDSLANVEYKIVFGTKTSYNGHGMFVSYAKGLVTKGEVSNADLTVAIRPSYANTTQNFGTSIDPITAVPLLTEISVSTPYGMVLHQKIFAPRGDGSLRKIFKSTEEKFGGWIDEWDGGKISLNPDLSLYAGEPKPVVTEVGNRITVDTDSVSTLDESLDWNDYEGGITSASGVFTVSLENEEFRASVEYAVGYVAKLSFNGHGLFLSDVSGFVQKAVASNADVSVRILPLSDDLFMNSGSRIDPIAVVPLVAEVKIVTANGTYLIQECVSVYGDAKDSFVSGGFFDTNDFRNSIGSKDPVVVPVTKSITVTTQSVNEETKDSWNRHTNYKPFQSDVFSVCTEDNSAKVDFSYVAAVSGLQNGHGAFSRYAECVVQKAYAGNADISVRSEPLEFVNFGTKVDPITGIPFRTEIEITEPSRTVLYQCCYIIKGDSNADSLVCSSDITSSASKPLRSLENSTETLNKSFTGNVTYDCPKPETLKDDLLVTDENKAFQKEVCLYQIMESDSTLQFAFQIASSVGTKRGHGQFLSDCEVAPLIIEENTDSSVWLQGAFSKELNTSDNRVDPITSLFYPIRVLVSGDECSYYRTVIAYIRGDGTVLVSDTDEFVPVDNLYEHFSLSFDKNGGEGTMESQAVFGSDVENRIQSCAFTREGYRFTGWNTVDAPTASEPGKSYKDKDLITLHSDLKLYAQWELLPATAPVIESVSKSAESVYGDSAVTSVFVKAVADANAEYDITYQWCVNSVADVTSGALIEGATGSEYKLPAGRSVGTEYYYCVITAVRRDNRQSAVVTTEPIPVVVKKAPLRIIAKDMTIAYGELPTDSGVTYEGFVGEDTADDLTGTLIFDYDYKQNDEAGKYSIVPKGLTSAKYEITFVAGVLTVESKPDAAVYTATWKNASWKQGSKEPIIVTVKRSVEDASCFRHFRSVTIGGKTLTAGKDYDAVSGSTVVTISTSYLETLNAGEYAVSVVFDDGEVTTSFKVTEDSKFDSPNTGEVSQVYVPVLAAIAFCGVFALVYGKKKREEV
ncbi:MAG: InlB B-repeat-containing protein [Lachnospiraceae bacterium]|nr:InlB B-repeat-containing protein [Lachnospiraceae bacterium]